MQRSRVRGPRVSSEFVRVRRQGQIVSLMEPERNENEHKILLDTKGLQDFQNAETSRQNTTRIVRPRHENGSHCTDGKEAHLQNDSLQVSDYRNSIIERVSTVVTTVYFRNTTA